MNYSQTLNSSGSWGNSVEDVHDRANVFAFIKYMFEIPFSVLEDNQFLSQRIESYFIFCFLFVLTIVYVLCTIFSWALRLVVTFSICCIKRFEYWLWPLNPPKPRFYDL